MIDAYFDGLINETYNEAKKLAPEYFENHSENEIKNLMKINLFNYLDQN